MIRAFLAIKILGSTKEELTQLQEIFKQTGANAQWTPKKNLHLTLKFLGDTEEVKLSILSQRLSTYLKKVKSFSLQLENVGAFPKIKHPRVVWAGVTTGVEPLTQLAEQVEAICATTGFKKAERPFHPHLTLGRVRASKGNQRLTKQLTDTTFQASQITPVNEVVLFQSKLQPDGPIYAPLAKFRLG